jgi:hypothetical protein
MWSGEIERIGKRLAPEDRRGEGSMRRTRNWMLALLLAALAVAPRAASAFALDLDGAGHVLHWVTGAETSIPYQLAPGNVPFGSAGENAIHRAFATWSAVSPTLEYRFDGYADGPVMANDGRNVVLFVYEQWPFDPAFAAITFRYYDEEDGRLLDTDVAFNAESYAWSVGGSGFDIENSATHEVGHLSGLGHSDVEEATMSAATLPGETAKRSLHADDREGIQAIYGAHLAGRSPAVVSPPVEIVATEVSFESGVPSEGALFVVAAALLALTVRGMRRLPRNENPVFEFSRRRAA